MNDQPRNYVVFGDGREEDIFYFEEMARGVVFATKSGVYCINSRGSFGLFVKNFSYSWCESNPDDMGTSFECPMTEVAIKEIVVEKAPEAYWEYSRNWRDRETQCIDDAKCTNCGFKHPTVTSFFAQAPYKLYKFCPCCGKRMGHKEV